MQVNGTTYLIFEQRPLWFLHSMKNIMQQATNLIQGQWPEISWLIVQSIHVHICKTSYDSIYFVVSGTKSYFYCFLKHEWDTENLLQWNLWKPTMSGVKETSRFSDIPVLGGSINRHFCSAYWYRKYKRETHHKK
jgi:hypothetical protein